MPNVRGSTGYGKTYLKLDNAEKREDSVKDIGALLDWIAQQPELDASRVAVTGGSYGGYMVLASLRHFGDRIKAGIDIVGIANFITFLENTLGLSRGSAPGRIRRRARPEDAGRLRADQPRQPRRQDQLGACSSPTAGTTRACPSAKPSRSPPRSAASGRPVWTVYADNEGHGFAKKDNRDYLRAVEAWFLKQSLGVN